MGRLVAYRPAAVPGAAEAVSADGADDFLTRVGKLLPAEVVAFYFPLSQLIGATNSRLPQEVLYWVLFGFGLLGTFLYVKKRGRVERTPWKTHALLTSIGFCLWSYALGGPWAAVFDPVLAAILLGAYELLTGAITVAFLDKPAPPPPGAKT